MSTPARSQADAAVVWPELGPGRAGRSLRHPPPPAPPPLPLPPDRPGSPGVPSDRVRLRPSCGTPALSSARCSWGWSAVSRCSVSGRSTVTWTVALPSSARPTRTCIWPSSAGSSRTVTAPPPAAWASCTMTGATWAAGLAGLRADSAGGAAVAGDAADNDAIDSGGAAGTAGACSGRTPDAARIGTICECGDAGAGDDGSAIVTSAGAATTTAALCGAAADDTAGEAGNCPSAAESVGTGAGVIGVWTLGSGCCPAAAGTPPPGLRGWWGSGRTRLASVFTIPGLGAAFTRAGGGVAVAGVLPVASSSVGSSGTAGGACCAVSTGGTAASGGACSTDCAAVGKVTPANTATPGGAVVVHGARSAVAASNPANALPDVAGAAPGTPVESS